MSGTGEPEPTDHTDDSESVAEVRPAGEAAAAEALRAAFARLQPQGSDAWNFLAAFTHLGDRYGPYSPGASGSELLGRRPDSASDEHGRLARRLRRRGSAAHGAAHEQTELEAAMAQVVEALRFLSARVETLEARLAAEDAPVEGRAWLAPARELGEWVGPLTAHLLATTPGGPVVHADCGEGALLTALGDRGAPAHGVEPRGSVALGALERGCAVTISEAGEYLSTQPAASLGGLVLSGVVDRLPLYAVVPLLGQCRRTLAHGAPLVVVSEPPNAGERWDAAATDLLTGRPLHEASWEMLLQRAGFVRTAPLAGPVADDGRFALGATAPS